MTDVSTDNADNKEPMYIWLTGLAILIWFTLYSSGLSISSEPYLCALKKGFSWGNFIVTTLVFTPSNIAILCVVAGFIGGCTSQLIGKDQIQARIDSEIKKEEKLRNLHLIENLERRMKFLTESPFLSAYRGFLTFLGVISGFLLLVSDPFSITTTEQYARIAGLISGFSFLMGYDPTLFEEFITKFSNWNPNGG